jgi:hypothetical protein
VALVGELRRDGITAIESIQAWRVASADSAPRQPGSQSPRLTRLADGTPVSPLFAPYMWGGRNYLQKMLHDADFVSEFPDVVRGGKKARSLPLFPPSPALPPPNIPNSPSPFRPRASSQCAILGMSPAVASLNPLFAPANLGVGVKPPPVPSVTEYLMRAQAAAEHRSIIGRALVQDFADDAIAVMAAAIGAVAAHGPGAGFGGGGGAPPALSDVPSRTKPAVTPLTKLAAGAANAAVHVSLATSTKRVVPVSLFHAGEMGPDDILETDVRLLLQHKHVRALVERVRMVHAQIAIADEAARDLRMAEARAVGNVAAGVIVAVAAGTAGPASASSMPPTPSSQLQPSTPGAGTGAGAAAAAAAAASSSASAAAAAAATAGPGSDVQPPATPASPPGTAASRLQGAGSWDVKPFDPVAFAAEARAAAEAGWVDGAPSSSSSQGLVTRTRSRAQLESVAENGGGQAPFLSRSQGATPLYTSSRDGSPSLLNLPAGDPSGAGGGGAASRYTPASGGLSSGTASVGRTTPSIQEIAAASVRAAFAGVASTSPILARLSAQAAAAAGGSGAGSPLLQGSTSPNPRVTSIFGDGSTAGGGSSHPTPSTSPFRGDMVFTGNATAAAEAFLNKVGAMRSTSGPVSPDGSGGGGMPGALNMPVQVPQLRTTPTAYLQSQYPALQAQLTTTLQAQSIMASQLQAHLFSQNQAIMAATAKMGSAAAPNYAGTGMGMGGRGSSPSGAGAMDDALSIAAGIASNLSGALPSAYRGTSLEGDGGSIYGGGHQHHQQHHHHHGGNAHSPPPGGGMSLAMSGYPAPVFPTSSPGPSSPPPSNASPTSGMAQLAQQQQMRLAQLAAYQQQQYQYQSGQQPHQQQQHQQQRGASLSPDPAYQHHAQQQQQYQQQQLHDMSAAQQHGGGGGLLAAQHHALMSQAASPSTQYLQQAAALRTHQQQGGGGGPSAPPSPGPGGMPGAPGAPGGPTSPYLTYRLVPAQSLPGGPGSGQVGGLGGGGGLAGAPSSPPDFSASIYQSYPGGLASGLNAEGSIYSIASGGLNGGNSMYSSADGGGGPGDLNGGGSSVFGDPSIYGNQLAAAAAGVARGHAAGGGGGGGALPGRVGAAQQQAQAAARGRTGPKERELWGKKFAAPGVAGGPPRLVSTPGVGAGPRQSLADVKAMRMRNLETQVNALQDRVHKQTSELARLHALQGVLDKRNAKAAVTGKAARAAPVLDEVQLAALKKLSRTVVSRGVAMTAGGGPAKLSSGLGATAPTTADGARLGGGGGFEGGGDGSGAMVLPTLDDVIPAAIDAGLPSPASFADAQMGDRLSRGTISSRSGLGSANGMRGRPGAPKSAGVRVNPMFPNARTGGASAFPALANALPGPDGKRPARSGGGASAPASRSPARTGPAPGGAPKGRDLSKSPGRYPTNASSSPRAGSGPPGRSPYTAVRSSRGRTSSPQDRTRSQGAPGGSRSASASAAAAGSKRAVSSGPRAGGGRPATQSQSQSQVSPRGRTAGTVGGGGRAGTSTPGPPPRTAGTTASRGGRSATSSSPRATTAKSTASGANPRSKSQPAWGGGNASVAASKKEAAMAAAAATRAASAAKAKGPANPGTAGRASTSPRGRSAGPAIKPRASATKPASLSPPPKRAPGEGAAFVPDGGSGGGSAVTPGSAASSPAKTTAEAGTTPPPKSLPIHILSLAGAQALLLRPKMVDMEVQTDEEPQPEPEEIVPEPEPAPVDVPAVVVVNKKAPYRQRHRPRSTLAAPKLEELPTGRSLSSDGGGDGDSPRASPPGTAHSRGVSQERSGRTDTHASIPYLGPPVGGLDGGPSHELVGASPQATRSTTPVPVGGLSSAFDGGGSAGSSFTFGGSFTIGVTPGRRERETHSRGAGGSREGSPAASPVGLRSGAVSAYTTSRRTSGSRAAVVGGVNADAVAASLVAGSGTAPRGRGGATGDSSSITPSHGSTRESPRGMRSESPAGLGSGGGRDDPRRKLAAPVATAAPAPQASAAVSRAPVPSPPGTASLRAGVAAMSAVSEVSAADERESPPARTPHPGGRLVSPAPSPPPLAVVGPLGLGPDTTTIVVPSRPKALGAAGIRRSHSNRENRGGEEEEEGDA